MRLRSSLFFVRINAESFNLSNLSSAMAEPVKKLYRLQQIKTLEQLASQKIANGPNLMEKAGVAAFKLLQKYWPEAKSILIFCGKGNNGGDGYVVARLAKQQGLRVLVYHIGELVDLADVAQQAWQACHLAGVDIQPFANSDPPLQADVIVDALLGIGIRGEVSNVYAAAIAMINSAQKPVLSIDVPSGIDADTGRCCGSAVHAFVTITFIALKTGLFTGAAPAYCGKVEYDPLLPDSAVMLEQVPADAILLSLAELLRYLPPRRRDSNKGDFGHVLIVGGNYGAAGAARMAGEAAARVGAGLVSVATRPEHAAAITGQRPELMCHAIYSPADFSPLLNRATVLVIGPGLGQDSWAQELFTLALAARQFKIVDADGLNLLAKVPGKRNDWILTPHPGEAGRLLNCPTTDIQSDRFTAASGLQQNYGGVIVLKGAGTLIKSADIPGICSAGNPGMATGGMGDVLSGILGGLVAQGLGLETAAQLGVLLHARAADKVANKQGERGMLALDLMAELHALVNPG